MGIISEIHLANATSIEKIELTAVCDIDSKRAQEVAQKYDCHVLVEKPLSVHKVDCGRLIQAHQDKTRIFAAMFNHGTDPR